MHDGIAVCAPILRYAGHLFCLVCVFTPTTDLRASLFYARHCAARPRLAVVPPRLLLPYHTTLRLTPYLELWTECVCPCRVPYVHRVSLTQGRGSPGHDEGGVGRCRGSSVQASEMCGIGRQREGEGVRSRAPAATGGYLSQCQAMCETFTVVPIIAVG